MVRRQSGHALTGSRAGEDAQRGRVSARPRRSSPPSRPARRPQRPTRTTRSAATTGRRTGRHQHRPHRASPPGRRPPSRSRTARAPAPTAIDAGSATKDAPTSQAAVLDTFGSSDSGGFPSSRLPSGVALTPLRDPPGRTERRSQRVLHHPPWRGPGSSSTRRRPGPSPISHRAPLEGLRSPVIRESFLLRA